MSKIEWDRVTERNREGKTVSKNEFKSENMRNIERN